MNKFEAMKTLANAYWYVRDIYGKDEAAAHLEDKFGYVRRSLTLEDLRPVPVKDEGLNGRMPVYF